MANFIESFGYNIGKVHIGILAYICDLCREGQNHPLQAFLSSLEIPFPERPVARREWKIGPCTRVDLAIFDGDNEHPNVIVELKVDDYETTRRIDGSELPQTVIYANATPHVPDKLFVTVGTGEYYRPPADSRFRWVRLPHLIDIISAIPGGDRIIDDYKQALENELNRRSQVAQNDRSNLSLFRSGAWNMTFLGILRETLLKSLDGRQRGIDPSCYTYGTRPDTILNFGWSQYPQYAEINSNGTLNLKVTFEDCQSEDERMRVYGDVVRKAETVDKHSECQIHPYFPGTNTMTVCSFNIGLNSIEGAFNHTQGQEYSINQLRRLLESLYPC